MHFHASWLVGWLVGGLVGWWVGWLVGWLVGRLAGWLVGGWVGWLVGWLVCSNPGGPAPIVKDKGFHARLRSLQPALQPAADIPRHSTLR